ncbi:MAG: aldose epimerase family protein [Actinomycetota bacterium]
MTGMRRILAGAAILALALGGGTMALAAAKGKATAVKGVRIEAWGKTYDGTPVDRYTLTNKHGLIAKLTNLGATVTELHVPDKNGKLADVVLGFDDVESYLKGHPYFGVTTGRVANRIAKGKFTLNGKTYQLAINHPPNHLHGGAKGLDKQIWKGEPIPSAEGPSVRFMFVSHDGDGGYPGSLAMVVTYTLTDNNELKIHYSANTDQDTPVNLTNHSYFNLAGEGNGDILKHELTVMADRYTPTDDTFIPTGEIAPVKGTPYDFTKPTPMGSRIKEIKGDPGGYDLNYVLNSGGKSLELAARVYEPTSGRVMEILTDEPGIQFYTGNYLDGTLTGKSGKKYQKNYAFCLETQHFPDSVNQPNFPSTILKPREVYTQTTIHRFSTR